MKQEEAKAKAAAAQGGDKPGAKVCSGNKSVTNGQGCLYGLIIFEHRITRYTQIDPLSTSSTHR